MNKNNNINALTGLGIFLVVLGHSPGVLPDVAEQLAANNFPYHIFRRIISLIYTFHMPLFFVVSGFLYHYSRSNYSASFPSFFKKKFSRLIIPYIIISSLTFPVKAILSEFSRRPIEFGWNDYLKSLYMPWDNPIIYFWFLPTLMLIMLISKPILTDKKNRLADYLILISSCFLYFYLDHYNKSGWGGLLNIEGALHNYIYFFIGYFICKNKKNILLKPNIFYLFPFILLASLFYLTNFENELIFFLSISGIYASFFLSSIFLRWFSYLGSYSYQIYLLSWFPQTFSRVVFGQILDVSVWISVFFSLVLGLAIPILIVSFLRKLDNRFILRTILGF